MTPATVTAPATGINFAAALPHPPIFVAGIGSAADHAEAHASRRAYAQAASLVVAAKPELLVIATPHGRIYRNCFSVSTGSGACGDWRSFGRDPERYKVAYDEGFSKDLLECAKSAGIPCAKGDEAILDHGVMVPLHFLLAAGLSPEACKFARISISLLDENAHYQLGRCVQEIASSHGRKTVFIASGDLSHRLKNEGPYSYSPEGPAFDRAVTEVFATGDFARFFSFDDDFRENAGECGLNSFLMMAGVFDGYDVEAQLHSYEGPWGVGYGVATFARRGPNPARHFVKRPAIL